MNGERIDDIDRNYLEKLVLEAQRAEAALAGFVAYLSQKYNLRPEQRIMLTGLVTEQSDQKE